MSSTTPPPPPPPPGGEYGSGGYGAQMPPMPGGGSAQPATRPKSIDLAVTLMQVGGVLSLLSLVLAFATKSQIRDAVQKASDKRATPLSPAMIDTSVNVAVGSIIFVAIVGALLWFWMASVNGKGRSWGRIVATVFFALNVLSFLLSFAQAGSALSRVASLVIVAVGGYVIFLLYRKDSSAYYQAVSAPPQS